jgi:hypothetical protein
MCYDDGVGRGAMLAICPPEHEALLDCGDDDYFNTDPPDGSYLARAWNTADSGFLYDDGAAAPARLALTGAATITWGGRVGLRGRLTDQGTGAGLAGDPVNLIARPAGAGADQAAGTATSDADGGASFTVTPAATTAYRASFPGSDSHGIAGSPQVLVTVRPQLTARLQARMIGRGRSVTVTGKVSPNHRGQRVYLERLVKGSWKGAASAVLTSASGYTLRATPSVRGRLTYRVRKRADSDHASAVAPTLTVTVR